MKALQNLRSRIRRHPHTRRVIEGTVVALLVATAFSLVHRTETLEAFERTTLDWRFQHYAPSRPPHPDVVVVEITDDDLDSVYKATKKPWPWPRNAYGIAAKWLKEAGARSIFFDLSYQDWGATQATDDAFAKAAADAGNVFILATFGAPTQRYPDRLPALEGRSVGAAPAWMRRWETAIGPYDSLIPAARGIVDPSYSSMHKDHDGIARRYPAGSAFHDRAFLSPGVALAADYLGQPVAFEKDGLAIGDRHILVDASGQFPIDWHGRFPKDRQHETGAFNPKGYSLGGVIATVLKTAPKPYDPADFKGKIVLVGASAEGLFDFKSTSLGTVLGVELHAMVVDNILHREFIRRAPRAAVVGLIFGLALFSGVVGMLFPIRLTLPLVGLMGAAYVWGVYAAFGGSLVWLDFVAPLGSLGGATLASALVNYAVEGRQKRDIRNKFGTYLTPEYVKLLEENPDMFKLGGEERVGTAFFSDLSGFTAMSEKMTAAELVARMNEYLTLMTRSIKRFRGTVDKYEGDAIVAFWNAPVPQPDHAVLACRAALDNQKELAGLRERWIKDYGVTVVARIGINTGTMIFGNMGSDEKFNYTMMGDPVNLASRLEGANKDYATFKMIGPDTYELVKNDFECRELDLLKVKGKQIPVTVYELICEKGQLDSRTREALERYTLGLQAYRMKQFMASERLFNEALEIKPDDGPSKLYLERSRGLIAKPPEPGWTYIYEKKDK